MAVVVVVAVVVVACAGLLGGGVVDVGLKARDKAWCKRIPLSVVFFFTFVGGTVLLDVFISGIDVLCVADKEKEEEEEEDEEEEEEEENAFTSIRYILLTLRCNVLPCSRSRTKLQVISTINGMAAFNTLPSGLSLGNKSIPPPAPAAPPAPLFSSFIFNVTIALGATVMIKWGTNARQ